MTITELIERLEEIRDKHGDLDVEYTYNDCGDDLGWINCSIDDVTVETIKSSHESSKDRTFVRIS